MKTFTFIDTTGKPQTTEQAAASNTYPHVNAAWCHCAKCSNHAAYIYDFQRRVEEAQARIDARGS
jgi:hypothetical protein